MARCPGPVNQLVMLRTRGFYGPVAQPVGRGVCVKGPGNAFASGGPLSGVRVSAGAVVDENTVQIVFNACVDVSGVTGIQVRINDGAWTEVSSFSQPTPSPSVSFDISGTIVAGDSVRWRYLDGSGTIVDCSESEDIGSQEIGLANPLGLEGDFVLLETGGIDFVLLEDDLTGDDGVQLETA